MEIKEFAAAVIKQLSIDLGEEVTVRTEMIPKNNGIILTGLIIGEKNKSISPTIYIDEMYQEYVLGTPIAQICSQILSVYESSRDAAPIDITLFTNYDNMLKGLAYRLIHLDKNEELLERIPYIPFYDLAIVFYYLFDDTACGGESNCSILIHNHHMKMWGIGKKELLKAALMNTPVILPPVLRTLQQVIIDMCKDDLRKEMELGKGQRAEGARDEEWLNAEARKRAQPMLITEEDLPMYVLGNERKLFGAATMLYREGIRAVAEQLGGNIYILPCSIHELIIIPDDGHKNCEQMKFMVSDVNATQLDPEEILSDSVYYYNMETNKVDLLC